MKSIVTGTVIYFASSHAKKALPFKMQIKCTKPGSAILKIKFIAGGEQEGSNQATGGMVITREVAILARPFATNGGWL